MLKMFTAGKVWKLCVGLAFTASVIATPTMGQKSEVRQAHSFASTQEMMAKKVTINGTVKSVTESTLTIVDSEKAEQTISLDAKTKITKAGKAATAADIKADDSVVIVANKGEGTLTAVTITVS
ncbi:MAG: hypothetical protein ND866_00250 [Pyrinomonadaceae bacterium]|nr:hypothetical protein [Pyrinomonadaceae bacterium]